MAQVESVLIRDEISMVSAEFLEYFDQVITGYIRAEIKEIKELILPGKPFGGLQVWSISGNISEKQTYTSTDQFLNKGLAFEAPAWHKANLNTGILQCVFRQEDSVVDLLNGIRTGEKPAALLEIMSRCSRPLPVVHGILPTLIFRRTGTKRFIDTTT